MTGRVLIVKHEQHEGPGLLRDVLQDHRVGADVVELHRGDRIPVLDAYGALVVLGGPPSANDTTELMAHETQRVREAVASGLPFLGVCLGMQILARVAGGAVVPSPRREVGFRDHDGKQFSIDLTEAGRNDPLFDGVPNRFPVFQMHGETVELTSEIELLGTAPGCPNQIIRVGRRAYGLQLHMELVPEMVGIWAVREAMLEGVDAAMLQRHLIAIHEEYTRNSRRLFTNFLAIAGLAETVNLNETVHTTR